MQANSATPQQCARALLEVMPLAMRSLRSLVRQNRAPELSLVQFRSLAFVGRNKGAMVSQIADHLGMTLPSASRLIDGLVEKKLVSRGLEPTDRRRVALSLTPLGDRTFRAALDLASEALTERTKTLTREQRIQFVGTMENLRSLFTEPLSGDGGSGRRKPLRGVQGK